MTITTNNKGYNPFRDIKPILTAEKIFEICEREAMKVSVKGTSSIRVSILVKTKRMEAARIEKLAIETRKRLFTIVNDFPSIDTLPEFYIEIANLILNINEIKKILGSISGAANVIWKIKHEMIGDVWNASTVLNCKKIRRSTFMRIKSIIIKLDKRLKKLEKSRLKLRKIPGFDTTLPTFCIAGYPNVGKSSLVRLVTNAKPEIGSYPFTTKNVSLGHLEIPIFSKSKNKIGLIRCQIVDTPGLLDRDINKRNAVELRAIIALKHLASIILFIFDVTQDKDYESQMNLFYQIKETFKQTPIIVIFSKKDLFNDHHLDYIAKLKDMEFREVDTYVITNKDPEGIKNMLIEIFNSKFR